MVTITHAKNVAIADDPKAAAAGEVLPSDWNATHVATGIRDLLTANRDYYVSATGSDSNGGTNSTTDAWLTPQHADDFISSNLDFGGFQVTVNIGAGQFIGPNQNSKVGGGAMRWEGAGNTLTSFVGGSASVVFNFNSHPEVITSVNNLTLDASVDAGFGLPVGIVSFSFSGATLYLGTVNGSGGNLNFKPGDSTFILGGITAEGQNTIFVTTGTATVDGSGTAHSYPFITPTQGPVVVNFSSWAFINTPDFGDPLLGGGARGFISPNLFGVYIDFSGNYTGSFNGAFLSEYWASFVSLPIVPPTGNKPNFIDGTSILAQQNGGLNGWGGEGVVTVAGSPTTSQLPVSGLHAFVKDTTNGIRYLACNDGGSIFVKQIGRNINTQTSTNYTAALFDQDGRIEMNNAGANTVTVPSSTTTFFPVGTEIKITQIGAGATTITLASTSMTGHNFGALSGQWATVGLYKRGADEWVQTSL